MSKSKKEVYVNSDWCKYWNNDTKIKRLPIYPRVAHNKFVMHFKDYEPTFNFYGLPDYVAALEHICVDYEIGKWKLSLLCIYPISTHYQILHLFFSLLS